MDWYKRDPDKARLDWLKARYGDGCCGEYPQPEHVRHFVYVVGRGGGPIKIGLCRDLERRVKQLQTACPFPLDLFWSATVPSREIAREIEMAVMGHFPPMQGEWIDSDPAPIVLFLEQ